MTKCVCAWRDDGHELFGDACPIVMQHAEALLKKIRRDPPPADEERCERCRFYISANPENAECWVGYCRRHAPATNERTGSQFPTTSIGGWCGDFEGRPAITVDVLLGLPLARAP